MTETFFKSEELEFFRQWGYAVYDPGKIEHIQAKDYLLNTVWSKTVEWAVNVIEFQNKYEVDSRRYWSQRGWGEINGVKRRATRVKPYTWAKLFLKGHQSEHVFFTIGLSSKEEHFIVKIDYQKERDTKLNQNQKLICEQYLTTFGPDWLIIPFTKSLSWIKLVAMTNEFINANEPKYLELLNLVWPNA